MRKCAEKGDRDIKQLRPAPVIPKDRFVGRPLSEVVDFHQRLIRKEASWNKFYFVAAPQRLDRQRGVRYYAFFGRVVYT